MKRTRTPPDIQYRYAEIRAADDSAGFTGYASVFGNVDAYGTAITRGAFTKTLKERAGRIPVLWQHNPDTPIGKPNELKEDDNGLYVDAAIVEDAGQGAEAMALLRAGVPLGLSIGFETIKSRSYEEADEDRFDWSDAPAWMAGEGHEYLRVIEEVRLWEFSVVSFAANEQATIDDVRSAAAIDLITTLTEDLRAGRVNDDDVRTAPLHLLNAAYRERFEPKPDPDAGTTPLDPGDARHRNRFAELVLIELGASHGVTA